MDRFSSLKALLKEFSSDQSITPETTFEELHMDSHAVVDFMLKVEETFGIVLDNDMILKVKTVQDVLDLIQQDTEEEAC